MGNLTIKNKEDKEPPKRKPTQPWRPAQHLALSDDFVKEIKKKGYVPRWVRADAENVEKKKAEGWVFVNTKGNPVEDSTIIDGSKSDSSVKKRNLILMAMPKELIDARREYHKGLVRTSVPDKVDSLKRDTQGASYGRITIEAGSPADLGNEVAEGDPRQVK